MSEPQRPPGIDARAAAAWMRAHPERRLALLRDEGAESGDPAGDPAIAANLRFLADGRPPTARWPRRWSASPPTSP